MHESSPPVTVNERLLRDGPHQKLLTPNTSTISKQRDVTPCNVYAVNPGNEILPRCPSSRRFNSQRGLLACAPFAGICTLSTVVRTARDHIRAIPPLRGAGCAACQLADATTQYNTPRARSGAALCWSAPLFPEALWRSTNRYAGNTIAFRFAAASSAGPTRISVCRPVAWGTRSDTGGCVPTS